MTKKRTPNIDTLLPNAVTRRDFIHGLGGASLAALLPGMNLHAKETSFAPEQVPGYYPPAKMGLRGSHPGSYESAHAASWQGGLAWDNARQLNEEYDLIVAGGGISGLASAYYYRKANPHARILILENHDDFGGHAKRIEFNYQGSSYLSGGGSFFMAHDAFSQTALDLVKEIGIDIDAMLKGQPTGDFRQKSYGLKPSIFFDKKTYGRSATVTGEFDPFHFKEQGTNEAFLSKLDQMAFSNAAKRDFRRLLTEVWDCMPDLPPPEKFKKMAAISYSDFLLNYAKVGQEVVEYFDRFLLTSVGQTCAYIPAMVPMMYINMPGKNALGSKINNLGAEMNKERKEKAGPQYLGAYFPEGNAGIARLLVAKLIPESINAKDMNDVLNARIDYGMLDKAAHQIKLRLNSTVVNVTENSGKRPVNVTYMRGGQAYSVNARHCVMAGYNMMIPYLCPQLPTEQKAALKQMVKIPMMSASVLLKNGQALNNLGSAYYYSPGKLYVETMGSERSLGSHEFSFDPTKPVPLYMIGGLMHSNREQIPQEQFKDSRRQLLATSFEDLALDVTSHLDEMLSPGGFDSKRDIVGLVVNRWPHGYAYDFKGVHDAKYASGEAPYEIGRQKFGNIAIANSDAGAQPLANVAIDQGYRAINELLS